MVRNGDEEWLKVVRWSFIAMLNAEELGITSKNAGALKASGNPAQKRLLGSEGEAGKNMGLSADWAYNIVTQVGNYSEVLRTERGQGQPAANRPRLERAVAGWRIAIRVAGSLIRRSATAPTSSKSARSFPIPEKPRAKFRSVKVIDCSCSVCIRGP